MLRKRKAVALPGAIALASFMLIVSIAVSSIIVELITLNQIKTIVNQNNMHFAEIYSEFLSKDTGIGVAGRETSINNFIHDINTMDGVKYRYRTYADANDANENYRAFVVYKLNEDTIIYYAIYDSSNPSHPTIAYQTDSSNIYAPYLQKGEDTRKYQYLGGIIRLPDDVPPVGD